jgi:hypothetical protein
VPAGQSVQLAEFEADQLPGSQVLHTLDADREYVPAEQTLQDVAPAVPLKVPAAHDRQLEDPVYGR